MIRSCRPLTRTPFTFLAPNRYNPNNLPELENYVEYQVREGVYNLEANLAVLKYYQFIPNRFNKDICVKILIKALTNMPKADFILCKCLIDPAYVSRLAAGHCEPVSAVQTMLVNRS